MNNSTTRLHAGTNWAELMACDVSQTENVVSCMLGKMAAN